MFERIQIENNGNDLNRQIEVVKMQTENEYLINQLKTVEGRVKELQKEIDDLKMKEITLTQHWRAIEMLFSNENNDDDKHKGNGVEKGVQVHIGKSLISFIYSN